jgi:hypothetical protein
VGAARRCRSSTGVYPPADRRRPRAFGVLGQGPADRGDAEQDEPTGVTRRPARAAFLLADLRTDVVRGCGGPPISAAGQHTRCRRITARGPRFRRADHENTETAQSLRRPPGDKSCAGGASRALGLVSAIVARREIRDFVFRPWPVSIASVSCPDGFRSKCGDARGSRGSESPRRGPAGGGRRLPDAADMSQRRVRGNPAASARTV